MKTVGYRTVWTERGLLPDNPPTARRLGGHWLVLADPGGLGYRVAAALAWAGAVCSIVDCPQADPESVRSAIERAWPADDPPEDLSGVVDLWPLAAEVDALAGAALTVQPVVELVRRFAGAGTRPPLWLVTRGAQAVVASDSPSPAQAMVWGLGRVLATEYGDLGGEGVHLVDLDPSAGPADILKAMCAELAAPALGAVAHRAGVRRGPEPARPAGRSEQGRARVPGVRRGGMYLLTGGTGALGLSTAEELAAQGAAGVTLMSRCAGRSDAAARVARMRTSGVTVVTARGDAAVPADLRRALGAADAAGYPLRGAVHAEDGTDRAAGAQHLADVLADRTLDFLVFYSSGTTDGGAESAAADAYLDAMARRLTMAGRPTLSTACMAWVRPG